MPILPSLLPASGFCWSTRYDHCCFSVIHRTHVSFHGYASRTLAEWVLMEEYPSCHMLQKPATQVSKTATSTLKLVNSHNSKPTTLASFNGCRVVCCDECGCSTQSSTSDAPARFKFVRLRVQALGFSSVWASFYVKLSTHGLAVRNRFQGMSLGNGASALQLPGRV